MKSTVSLTPPPRKPRYNFKPHCAARVRIRRLRQIVLGQLDVPYEVRLAAQEELKRLDALVTSYFENKPSDPPAAPPSTSPTASTEAPQEPPAPLDTLDPPQDA